MKRFFCFSGTLLALLMVSCGPSAFDAVNEYPSIFPDCNGITIPASMAQDNAALFSFAMTDGSRHKDIRLMRDDTIWVTVRSWQKGDKRGKEYLPFPIIVTKDEPDPYIAYRLVDPGYES